MSLHPSDAPPTARTCDHCDGDGLHCERCDGGGHLLCHRYGSRHQPSGCTGFATHFFDNGEDDMCHWCWTHCAKCSEPMLFFPDDTLCPVCDARSLVYRPMNELVAAAKASC